MAAVGNMFSRQSFKFTRVLVADDDYFYRKQSAFTADGTYTCEDVENMTKFVISSTPEHIKAIPSTKEVLRNLWLQVCEARLVTVNEKHVYHVAR